jgi:hypothetical protein
MEIWQSHDGEPTGLRRVKSPNGEDVEMKREGNVYDEAHSLQAACGRIMDGRGVDEEK